MAVLETTLQARRYTVNFFNGQSGDESLSAGDVVVFANTDPTKVQKTTTQNDENVVGVVYGDTTSEGGMVTIVALGIADIKVTGTVNRGDILVTSTTSGRAIVAASGHQVGRAITTNSSGDGTVSAIISSGVITGSLTDHSVLSNLDVDDHGQYVQKTGRSGGQIIIGGTGSGEDITFQTTSDTTKGSYIFSEFSTSGVLVNDGSGVVTSSAPSTGQVLGESSGVPTWVSISTLSIFGSNSTYDQSNDRLGINETSPTCRLFIGGGSWLGGIDPFSLSGDEGIAILPGVNTARIAMQGTQQSDIIMTDQGSGSNVKTMQLITEGGFTEFRSLTDAGGIQADNIFSMDHNSGDIGFGTDDIEAWDASFTGIEFGVSSAIMFGATSFHTIQNAYYDGSWKYKTASTASNYYQSAGTHVFRVAASGSLDAAITWKDAFTITNDGLVNFTATMGNGTADPTADAPTDWVQIEIGGTTRYIPVYT